MLHENRCAISLASLMPFLPLIYLFIIIHSGLLSAPPQYSWLPTGFFECPKTLAGLCSSHPAALNGPSPHQLSTGLRKYTCTKSCQTTVNGTNIQTYHKSPLISYHTAYSSFCNGLTSRSKPLLSRVMLSSF